MNKYRIIHIIKDDKFFDGVFNRFENEDYLNNVALLEVKDVKNYQYRRIKNTEKVQLVDRKEMSATLKKGDYDALFFHSMPVERYEYVNWIPKGKIVIWWSWGFELYHPVQGLKPLIAVQLFKPQTKILLDELKESKFVIIKNTIRNYLSHFRYKRLQNRMLSRVDFFQPVIPLEYRMMCSIKGFQAKEFYYPKLSTIYQVETSILKDRNGGVLIGNSQSPNNNHLDVWHSLKDVLPPGRQVLFPINYLGDLEYAQAISNRIKSDKHKLLFIKNFMPLKDYFDLINGCSYAVFGVMRQQAMGNIFQCLKQGVKLFLYRDSIVYQCLKEYGFVIFAIENIDESSFTQPLTTEENRQNGIAMNKYRLYIESVTNNSFDEILTKKNYKG